jgi:uncharacterized surface protein with fasciclin (FAS1) repeats
MMMTNKHLTYIVLFSITILLFGCKDKWDLHTEIQDIDKTINLNQKIANQPNLSLFNDFLKRTGYDKILSNSQNYTVWAPENNALSGLDPAFVADTAKLRSFVANHIALTTIPVSQKLDDTTRVKLLNNKFATIIGRKFEETNIIGEAMFVRNGVLHTLEQAVPVKFNVWEYMLSTNDAPLQTNYISNLSTTVIDTANATVVGFNTNGTPIFSPNSPTVSRNTYWINVADLRDESQEYTFFMLQDAAFTAETNKLTSFYPSTNPNLNASFFVAKDLAVKGVFPLTKLPDTLVSVTGGKIPINRANIVKSYRASNGIVHVVRALPFRLQDKVPTFRIEGEMPSGFTANRAVLYRLKLDNLNRPFRDIQAYNHLTAEFGIFYTRPNLAVARYRVFARAIVGLTGDPQTVAFTQRYFIFNSTTNLFTLAFTQVVAPLTFNEVLLGEFTPAQFGNLQLRLTAANSTAQNANTLALDYLRFEPVLP